MLLLYCLLELSSALVTVANAETIWTALGKPVVVECKLKKGQMLRFEDPQQVLAIKFTQQAAQMIAPLETSWKLDWTNRNKG